MAGTPAVPDMRLELVPVPVSDVDRAKVFCEQAGFGNLHDTQVTEAMRVVQLTPPGSSKSRPATKARGPLSNRKRASRMWFVNGFVHGSLLTPRLRAAYR